MLSIVIPVFNEEKNLDELIRRCLQVGESMGKPFELVLVPINMHKSQRLRDAAESLYQDLLAAGIDVLLDDRKERPGVMFADMELIGIPHRLVISDSGLDDNKIEYRDRREPQNEYADLDKALVFIKEKLKR